MVLLLLLLSLFVPKVQQYANNIQTGKHKYTNTNTKSAVIDKCMCINKEDGQNNGQRQERLAGIRRSVLVTVIEFKERITSIKTVNKPL